MVWILSPVLVFKFLVNFCFSCLCDDGRAHQQLNPIVNLKLVLHFVSFIPIPANRCRWTWQRWWHWGERGFFVSDNPARVLGASSEIYLEAKTNRDIYADRCSTSLRKRSGRLIRWIFHLILVLVVHVSIALSATYYDSKSIWRHIELFNSSSISDDSPSMCQLLILFKFFIANPLLPASFCRGQM